MKKIRVRSYLFRWGITLPDGNIVDKNAEITLPPNVIASGRDDIGLWVELEVDEDALKPRKATIGSIVKPVEMKSSPVRKGTRPGKPLKYGPPRPPEE